MRNGRLAVHVPGAVLQGIQGGRRAAATGRASEADHFMPPSSQYPRDEPQQVDSVLSLYMYVPVPR